MVGIANVSEQCFLTCAAQNMKKMAKAFFTLFSVFQSAFFNPPFPSIWKTHAA